MTMPVIRPTAKQIHLIRLAFCYDVKPSLLHMCFYLKEFIRPFQGQLKAARALAESLSRSIPLGVRTWLEMCGDHILIRGIDGNTHLVGEGWEHRTEWFSTCSQEQQQKINDGVAVLKQRYNLGTWRKW